MKKNTILVVDDNKTNLALVRAVLSEEYDLNLANNGMLALRFLEKKKPDLILLDLMMPGMDGWETYRRMRKMENGADIPIIFLTADQNPETEVECLKQGASDFITKPIVPEVVLSRIAHTIELHKLRTDLEGRLEEAKESLAAAIQEQERINTELSVARQIQLDALPSVFPAFPDRKEFDLYACMHPAREIGGDFYDFFLLDEDHICLVIADVSGKGVPAALFMMKSKTWIKDQTHYNHSPAQIFRAVNEQLCQGNDADMFVTAWIGILEISTGKLTTANAGHEFPVLKRAGLPYELVHDHHGLVLAAMSGIPYREETLQLFPGDILYLYTDGVPEATSAAEELFGTARMVQSLNDCDSSETTQIIRHMEEAIRDFVQEAPQFDDITMLCLRYNGPQNGSCPQ